MTAENVILSQAVIRQLEAHPFDLYRFSMEHAEFQRHAASFASALRPCSFTEPGVSDLEGSDAEERWCKTVLLWLGRFRRHRCSAVARDFKITSIVDR